VDLDRITHPLRLARGSHRSGSGKGCAMNVVSYVNGDQYVTDFPATSARPLASFVQLCNDLLAGPDGYLSPQDSLVVLDLGWLTVGTADVPDTVLHPWVAKLLISPLWGVVEYAGDAARQVISAVAELHRGLAPGDIPSIGAWDGAARAARELSASLPVGAEKYAVRTAYQSTSLVHTDDRKALDAVTGNALRAHRLANGDPGGADRIVEVTRNAIRSWRHTAGLSVTAAGRAPVAAIARAGFPA